MEAFKVDPRKTSPEELAKGMKQAQLVFKLNHTMPYTPEYDALVQELFAGKIGEGYQRMIEASAMQRVGNPAEIAAAAEFLLSDRAAFITGTDLLVDGGMIAAIKTGKYNVQLS